MLKVEGIAQLPALKLSPLATPRRPLPRQGLQTPGVVWAGSVVLYGRAPPRRVTCRDLRQDMSNPSSLAVYSGELGLRCTKRCPVPAEGPTGQGL